MDQIWSPEVKDGPDQAIGRGIVALNPESGSLPSPYEPSHGEALLTPDQHPRLGSTLGRSGEHETLVAPGYECPRQGLRIALCSRRLLRGK